MKFRDTERYLEYNRKCKQRGREKYREDRRSRPEDKGRYSEYQRKYYQANREQLLQQSKERNKRSRERAKEQFQSRNLPVDKLPRRPDT